MARHMRDSEAQRTTVVRRTVQRPPQTKRRNIPRDDMPYGQSAAYRGLVEEPVVRELTWDDAPSRGGIYAFLRGLMLIFAWAVRLCAFAMTIVVLLNAVSPSFLQATLSRVTDLITSYLPWRNIGLLEVDTPFGGVLRGDLAILTLVLFVIDWLLCRIRASLR